MQNKYLSKNNWLITTIIITCVISLPIIVVLISIFLPKNQNWEHILDYLIWIYLKETMFIILWTGIISTFFGVLCAWFCTNVDFPFRRTISWMLILPLASPAYVIAYVYADLFEYGGIIHLTLENYSNLQIYSWPKEGLRSTFGASLVFAFVLYPYIYLLCRTSFIQKSE